MEEEEKLDLIGITGSNGIPVAELNNFQRYINSLLFTRVKNARANSLLSSRPFPYNKLPLEIREKIIRILLRPILSRWHNGRTEIEYFPFHIKPLLDPFLDLDYGNEDLYFESERQARRRYRDVLCYPGRSDLYKLDVYPVRGQCSNRFSKDWVYLEWLRQASHVSTSFRHELGQVLWSNTMLFADDNYEDMDEDDGSYPNHVLDKVECFIDERPAVLRGIKSLNVNLNIAKGQNINEWIKFDRWCDTIAENLVLDDAYFSIKVSKRDLESFMEEQECGLDALGATSNLRVSKWFDLKLARVDEEIDDYNSDEELDQVYQEVLLDFMMPLILGNREPETEEEKYLQARAEEVDEIEELDEAEETEITEESSKRKKAPRVDLQTE
jgi:hypothetical protein